MKKTQIDKISFTLFFFVIAENKRDQKTEKSMLTKKKTEKSVEKFW